MIFQDVDRSSIYRIEDILKDVKSAFDKVEIDPYSRKLRGLKIDVIDTIGEDAYRALYDSVCEAYNVALSVRRVDWKVMNSTRGGEMFGLDMIDIAYGHFVSVMSKLIDLRNKMIKTN